MTNFELFKALGYISAGNLSGAEQLQTVPRAVTHRKSWKRPVLIAAVIALALLLVGCAVVYVISESDWSDNAWFPKFFSGEQPTGGTDVLTDNQQEILERGLVRIDQSVTCNGYTITLEFGISDGYRMFIRYRVDAPEGIALNADNYELHYTTDMHIPRANDGNTALEMYSGEPLADDDPNDGSISELLEWVLQPSEDSDFSMTDGTVWTITFHDIQAENGAGEYETICEGTWEFKVTFSDDLLVTKTVELLDKPVRCSAVRSLGNNKFPLKVKVTSFELRALTATVCYKKPLTGFWEGVQLKPIYLVMKDGTRVEAHFRMSINRGGYEECIYLFDRPISADDVAYVDFP